MGLCIKLQLVGSEEVRFDWAKFAWIGSPDQNGSVFYMRADSPYKTVEDLRRAPETIRCSHNGSGNFKLHYSETSGRDSWLKTEPCYRVCGVPSKIWRSRKGEVQCRAVTTSTFLGREPYPSWLKKASSAFSFKYRASETRDYLTSLRSSSLWINTKHQSATRR